MKRLSKLMLVIAFVLLLVGCGNEKNNNDTPKNKDNNPVEKEKINLTNIQNKIENLGITCEKSDAFYQMVGASEGFKLKSGETKVEIYKFDKSSDAYKNAEKSQKLTLSGLDSSFDATVKNGYAYVIDNEFPKHDEVVKLLEQLN